MDEIWNAEDSETYGSTVIWSDKRTLPVGELRGFSEEDIRAIIYIPEMIKALKHVRDILASQSEETIQYLDSLLEAIEDKLDDEPNGSTETI